MYFHGRTIFFAVFAYLIFILFFLYCLLITDYTMTVTIIGLFIAWLIYKTTRAVNIWCDIVDVQQTTSSGHETLKFGKAVRRAFLHEPHWTGFEASTGEICVQFEVEMDERFATYLDQILSIRNEHSAFRMAEARRELKPKNLICFQNLFNLRHRSKKKYFKMQLISHANGHSFGWWSYWHGYEHGYIGLVNDPREINDILTWEDIENYIYPK